MLLMVRCPVCGDAEGAPCRPCAALLHPAPELPPPPGVDQCAALLAYEGAGATLVTALKYRNQRASVRGLAAAAATLVAPGADVVTWAPTAAERRRRRGFDQAEVIARAVARRLRVPCRSLLTRLPGPPQTGRSAEARWSGPQFSAHRRPPSSVLVVDDVVTTGATLAAAAQCLRTAGAVEVRGLALARTPLKPEPRSPDHCA